MVIGLTGYTGAGKSTVAQIFRELGAYIIDADQLAREIVEPGQPALAEIVQQFGAQMLLTNGSLHRRALGSIVFADEKKRKQLERITHPRIAELTRESVKQAGQQDVILDAPVLFEVPEMVNLCDKTMFVDAPSDVRLQRIMQRDQLDTQEAQRRIAAQQFMEEWKKQCDFVIENVGDVAELQQVIRQWMEVQRGRSC